MRDTRTILLILLSFGLVGTWVYHLYDKTQYSNRRNEVYIKDSIAVAEAVRDSLHRIYTATIHSLDTELDSTKNNADSLKGQLESKLGEINKLRTDIGAILQNRNATKADMETARKKIDELKQHVEDLRGQNTAMEDEKKRLNLVLEQLTSDMQGLEQNVKRLGDENKTLTEKINLASIFVASELRLNAFTVKNSKELESSQAAKISKFVISFVVQNNINDYSSADVYIVIIQPDRQVMQTSVWETGIFETRNEGRKNYSFKMHFAYTKGEAKHLIFSLNPDNYQTGIYTVQVYHNGALIGQTTKTLN